MQESGLVGMKLCSELPLTTSPSFLRQNLSCCGDWIFYAHKAQICFLNLEQYVAKQEVGGFKVNFDTPIACFEALCKSADTSYVVVGHSNLLSVLDIFSRTVIEEWKAPPEASEVTALCCWGSHLISVGTDNGSLAVLSFEALGQKESGHRKNTHVLKLLDKKKEHSSVISVLCFYSARESIALCSGDENGEVCIWNFCDNSLYLRTKLSGENIPCSAIASWKFNIIIGKLDGSFVILNENSGCYTQKVIAHGSQLLDLAIDEDRSTVTTVSSDGSLRMWKFTKNQNTSGTDIDCIQLAFETRFKTLPLTGVQYFHDDWLVVSGYDANSLLVYSLAS